MGRYLIKTNLKRRTIDYVFVPKKVKLLKVKGGYRVKSGNRKIGIVHKGYKLVNAKSYPQAENKFFRYIHY